MLPVRRGRESISPYDWLCALAEEIRALTADYFLDPFHVRATQLVHRVLDKMRISHQVLSVGANYHGGNAKVWLESFGALPATEAEIRDYFALGGTYCSAGYSCDQQQGEPQYLIVQVRKSWVLDLSGLHLMDFPAGQSHAPAVFDVAADLDEAWSHLLLVTHDGDAMFYQMWGKLTLGEDDALGQWDQGMDEIERVLWDRLAFYGWPLTLAGAHTREAAGHD